MHSLLLGISLSATMVEWPWRVGIGDPQQDRFGRPSPVQLPAPDDLALDPGLFEGDGYRPGRALDPVPDQQAPR